MDKDLSKKILDSVYLKYNILDLIHPDPLEFLFNYSNIQEREIVGLIASSLAYGRVNLILQAVGNVLNKMGDSPLSYIKNNPLKTMQNDFKNFKYRFTTKDDLIDLFTALKNVLNDFGSLENLFLSEYSNTDENILNSSIAFVSNLHKYSPSKKINLLPNPVLGSACKRLNLYFRWMIRHDNVDPGGWNSVSPSKLIIPLDTHMFYFGKTYGFTKRKSADLKTAIEITNGFKKFSPEDPVKYDFALTRFGIHPDMNWDDFDATPLKT